MNESISEQNFRSESFELKSEYQSIDEAVPNLLSAIIEWENEHPEERTLILIAGPTAAGKDTLLERMNLPKETTTFLSLDRYYLGAEELQNRDGVINFSPPTALDMDRASVDIDSLVSAKEGEKIKVPVFDMKQSRRIGEEELDVKRRVVVQGVYTFLVGLSKTPFKLYVDAKPETLLERKLVRDTKERNVAEEIVRQRFTNNVMPALSTVAQQKEKATIIVKNN